jgi:hypothetical protein
VDEKAGVIAAKDLMADSPSVAIALAITDPAVGSRESIERIEERPRRSEPFPRCSTTMIARFAEAGKTRADSTNRRLGRRLGAVGKEGSVSVTISTILGQGPGI